MPPRSLTLALVGFTDSYNDNQWFEMARAWLAAHDPDLVAGWPAATRRVFDLRGGNSCNFLDDVGHYDVVILFAIYNPPADSPEFRRSLAKPPGRGGQTSLAPNHTRANWRARLARTNAKHLLVFRREDSIDGDYLGEIEGYTKHPETPGVFGLSVYSK